jgi:hypothetical protein
MGKGLRLLGAVAIAVSGSLHLRLYFDDGYRFLNPGQAGTDRVLGLDVGRSFVLQFLAAAVIAAALLASLVVPRLALPAALAGIGLAAGSLVAYALARTDRGLLGFTDDAWSTEAKLAVAAELVAVVALAVGVAVDRRARAVLVRAPA